MSQGKYEHLIAGARFSSQFFFSLAFSRKQYKNKSLSWVDVTSIRSIAIDISTYASIPGKQWMIFRRVRGAATWKMMRTNPHRSVELRSERRLRGESEKETQGVRSIMFVRMSEHENQNRKYEKKSERKKNLEKWLIDMVIPIIIDFSSLAFASSLPSSCCSCARLVRAMIIHILQLERTVDQLYNSNNRQKRVFEFQSREKEFVSKRQRMNVK